LDIPEYSMSLTPHHAKYFAHDLTRRATSGMDRLSMSLLDAAVDLNPHQIEAALFALQSPLSKGVILADEGMVLIEEDFHRLLFEMEGAGLTCATCATCVSSISRSRWTAP
jgi:hypothetical protein